MACGAPRHYTHISSEPFFISTRIYIPIAVVGVSPITKVNKCNSRQRAGDSGVETAAALADRNREVFESMCHLNVISFSFRPDADE